MSDLCIVWKCYNFHLVLIAILSYSKFGIIPLQREGFAAKSNVSRKMFFFVCAEGIDTPHYLNI